MQSIALDLVFINKIVVSDQFENSHKGFKYFIGYKEDDFARTLCIIPQMSDIIKYFDNRGKNGSLMIEGDSVLKNTTHLRQNLKDIGYKTS